MGLLVHVEISYQKVGRAGFDSSPLRGCEGVRENRLRVWGTFMACRLLTAVIFFRIPFFTSLGDINVRGELLLYQPAMLSCIGFDREFVQSSQ